MLKQKFIKSVAILICSGLVFISCSDDHNLLEPTTKVNNEKILVKKNETKLAKRSSYVYNTTSEYTSIGGFSSDQITIPSSKSAYCYFYFRNKGNNSCVIQKIVGGSVVDSKTVFPRQTGTLFPHGSYAYDVVYKIKNSSPNLYVWQMDS